jgi:hypothetical protein
VLVLDLVEDFEGRGEDFTLSLVDSLDQLVSHIGEGLVVRLCLNVNRIIGVIDFIVEHVIVESR